MLESNTHWNWSVGSFQALVGGMEVHLGDIGLSLVTLREGEDEEELHKTFQTLMQRSGKLRELRNRRFFRSKGEQSRLERQRSIRRLRRRRAK